MKLRIPIVFPKGRKLIVWDVSRFSTDEQDATSITDQITFCCCVLAENGITPANAEIV